MNVLKLRSKMVEKNINVEKLCNETGIPKSRFYRRINNSNDDSFKIKEAIKIGKCLKLSLDEMNDIFFNHYVA